MGYEMYMFVFYLLLGIGVKIQSKQNFLVVIIWPVYLLLLYVELVDNHKRKLKFEKEETRVKSQN